MLDSQVIEDDVLAFGQAANVVCDNSIFDRCSRLKPPLLVDLLDHLEPHPAHEVLVMEPPDQQIPVFVQTCTKRLKVANQIIGVLQIKNVPAKDQRPAAHMNDGAHGDFTV